MIPAPLYLAALGLSLLFFMMAPFQPKGVLANPKYPLINLIPQNSKSLLVMEVQHFKSSPYSRRSTHAYLQTIVKPAWKNLPIDPSQIHTLYRFHGPNQEVGLILRMDHITPLLSHLTKYKKEEFLGCTIYIIQPGKDYLCLRPGDVVIYSNSILFLKQILIPSGRRKISDSKNRSIGSLQNLLKQIPRQVNGFWVMVWDEPLKKELLGQFYERYRLMMTPLFQSLFYVQLDKTLLTKGALFFHKKAKSEIDQCFQALKELKKKIQNFPLVQLGPYGKIVNRLILEKKESAIYLSFDLPPAEARLFFSLLGDFLTLRSP